jgi:uncharacterized protein
MPNIAYFEVPAEDLKVIRKFYQDVLGWRFGDMDLPGLPRGYQGIATGEDVPGTVNLGGLVPRTAGQEGFLVYVQVPDVEKSIERTLQAGGHVVRNAIHVQGVGLFAVVADPEGNIFGLHQGGTRRIELRDQKDGLSIIPERSR